MLPVLVFVVVGAGTDQGPAGAERSACYCNSTCDKGLVCLSDLCVGSEIATLRLRQLEKSLSGFVAGILARSNRYYSGATLTSLGRAVHCNVGRPALWVFPPSA